MNPEGFHIYCRVSSEEQKNRQTIQLQIEAANAHAAHSGIPLLGIYQDDGLSGDLAWEARPDAKRLLADARAGTITRLAVYMYDRFSRDVLEGLLAARELSRAGVTLFSLLEPFDILTPHGQYMFVQSLNNSQLWKKLFLQRTRDGQRRKALAGGWVGGNRTIYGCRIDGKRQSAHVIIDDTPVPEFGETATRADVARFIFTEIARRQSCHSVASHLNALGIPSMLGCQWSASGISHMIRNPAYKGMHRYGDEWGGKSHLAGIERPVPALVTVEVWEQANASLTANRNMSKKNARREYLLRGLIQCAHCGASYTGMTHNVTLAIETGNRLGVVYRCNSRCAQQGYKEPCRIAKSISGEIETIVWNKITEFLWNPSLVEQIISRVGPEQERERERHRDALTRVETAIAAKEQERNIILTQLRKGKITEAESDAQREEIRREEASLLEQQAELRRRSAAEENQERLVSGAIDALTFLAARLDNRESLSYEEKRYIVERMIKRITVKTITLENGKKDTEVTVSFHFQKTADCSRLIYPEGQNKQLHIEWCVPR